MRMIVVVLFLIFVISLLSLQAASNRARSADPSIQIPIVAINAMQQIDPERIRAHMRFLSHDLLEGRGTGQRGGDIAAEYIATQFALDGLQPAGDNGTFLQKVPIVGVTPDPATTFSLVGSSGPAKDLKPLTEYVAYNETQQPESDVDAGIVYVGYGIEAPEYDWDDYKGADVKGKVLLMLVNEPPSDDPKLFTGRALTYYGRWTYKYEEAARRGAVAAIIIHTTPTASYGWDVVRSSWAREDQQVRISPGQHQLAFAGWVTKDAGEKIAAAVNKSVDELLKIA